ncbi:ABC transporter ATP-binding protein [Pikeienuella sp. HZG-20]|uniref:ABC transporter ATP-binding protein n=1 Tax=Paludibacillus litoralis TaxID=3133267 RepID=UPI0030EC492E
MRRLFAGLIRPFAAAKGAPPSRFRDFLRWALAGAWPAILLAGGAGALVGGLEAVGSLLIGWVIDDALASDRATYFADQWPMLLFVAAFFMLIRPAAMTLSAALNSITLGPNLFAQVLARLNRHTLGQSLKFFNDDFAGRLAQKEMQTSTSITEVMLEMTNAMAFALATIAGTALVLANVNWRLTALLALWLFAYVLLIRWYLPRIRRLAKARAEARAGVTGRIVDTLSNMAVVKLFAHVGREEAGADRAIGRFRESALDFGVMAAGFRGVLMLLAGALPVLLIGGALMLWRGGGASAGDIAVAGMLSTRIAQMSGWISFTAMVIFAHLGEAEDGMRTLTPEHGVTDPPRPRPLARARGEVRFENVSYRYGARDGGGLDGFDLSIRSGEKVALVGGSGAGKTTALSLLLRLYDVEKGRITLDGVDIRTLRQDDLRRQIAMVQQETAMFNRAAAENIRYGRPDASREEMITAAREAEAHEFIQDLRDIEGRRGYEAHLGERGVKLSGGQRQRVALARAILKDAPILALDEATSALDSEVEASIQKSLDRLMEGRTVIAIAHRLSTIARMDRIIVMEAGRIVEIGTHDSLLAENGRYAGFWRRQSGGFIGLEAVE